MSLLILILIHLLILVGGVAAALLLPAQITTSLVISVAFCAIAYLVFAAMTVLAAVQSRQKAMQNGGMITASLIYFVVTFLGSVLFMALHLSTKIHILLEIIILILGIVLLLMMLMAKLHIESQ